MGVAMAESGISASAGGIEPAWSRPHRRRVPLGLGGGRGAGFTLIELLVTVAIIAILSSLSLPSITRAKGRSQQIFCANNIRQLTMAWVSYAGDNNDRLAYNLGGSEIKQMLREGENYNWANSLLGWETNESNTNITLNTEASLGPYLAHHAGVFRCPGDRAVSSVQRALGWTGRSRTYSMNAMAGDAGEFTKGGTNVNNPAYKQYYKMTEVKAPESIFVFLEEHPDSINDGYFVNKAYSWKWQDLPASYHNRGMNLSFADGHLEWHEWRSASTVRPAEPDGAGFPNAIELRLDDHADFSWLMERMGAH
jgi:prepilin-type N-terminal cleavage/methylation domain-containing protein/prepilin-type processing-associated H-X9-DG protein